MTTEAEVLYDLSKEFEILKEQCLFQHNMVIDSNNQIYLCLKDKIYIISLRKIALNKCVLQDVIDCTKMVYNAKDKTIENHFVDEITHMYNSKSASSQEEFASFVLKDDKINMMKDQLLRQRLITINNDILTLKIKNFRISKYGLAPGNHPLITILLSNGDAFNIGCIKSTPDSLRSYQIIENINKMITGQDQSNLEIMSFEWSEQFMSNQKIYQLLAVHCSNGFVYLYKYESYNTRVLLDKFNINSEKSKQIQFISYIDNKQLQLKLFVLTGKNIIVVHLHQSNQMQNNLKKSNSSGDESMKDLEQNSRFSLVEIKQLDFQFIDRILSFHSPNGLPPVLHLTHNQEIQSINSKDYSLLTEQPKQTFGGCLGKILAIFEDSTGQKYQIFNEKSQIQVLKNQNNLLKGQAAYVKVEQEIYEKEMDIESIDGEMNEQHDEEIQTFSTSMFLPYAVIQSVNQCFYIVCGAHSFTSQQISNILIINDCDNVSDPYVFMAKCIKNLEKSVYYNKNNGQESESQNSLLVMMPFNWDDILFYFLKNQNEFVDILKISLFIYDQQKGIKKLQQDPQLEKFDAFLKNLNVPLEKLSFINEKLLLFLTSMKKQQFKDFIDQQKHAILSRNYQYAYAQLKKNNFNSNLFKRLTKEVDPEITIQRIQRQSNQSVWENESITCILTNLDIAEEPILKCKSCKHYMIDLDTYLKQDPTNASINIADVFQFRNNICPLCSGLVVSLLS